MLCQACRCSSESGCQGGVLSPQGEAPESPVPGELCGAFPLGDSVGTSCLVLLSCGLAVTAVMTRVINKTRTRVAQDLCKILTVGWRLTQSAWFQAWRRTEPRP